MSKIKYIPILALSALLAGCGVFGGKAPKFADSGEEVKYSDFYNRCNNAIADSDAYDLDVNLTDRYIKESAYESRNTIVKRDGKEINKNETVGSTKNEYQFDVDNLVGKLTGEGKTTYKVKSPEGTANYTVDSKVERYYQFQKVSGVRYLIYANAKTKEYNRREQVSSSRKQEDIFNDVIRQEIAYMFTEFSRYIPSSSSDAKDYLFYIKDENLFTISLTNEKTTKGDDYNEVTKNKIKVQLDTTDKKQAVRISSEVQTESTYKKDSNSYKKGDVVTETLIRYMDYSVANKDIKLSSVDIGDYLLTGSYI